jgi:hypothetical protein
MFFANLALVVDFGVSFFTCNKRNIPLLSMSEKASARFSIDYGF